MVFKVVFPDSLKPEQITQIDQALSTQKGKNKDVDMEVAETCNMIEYKEFHRNTHHEGGQEGGHGSDEEGEDGHGHGGRQRV